MTPVNQQVFHFVFTLLIGFIFGLIFDFYRIFRWLFKPKKFGTYLGDLFLWILLTALGFNLLLVSNLGEVRFYVFIGMGAGFALYYRFFSPGLTSFLRNICLEIMRWWRWIRAGLFLILRTIQKLVFALLGIISMALYQGLILGKVLCRCFRRIICRCLKFLLSLLPFKRNNLNTFL
ncbi:spore cortex biosynthesis protein YabQ [Calderihabitans maritimus]|uniref:Spore cortex biosynthesis protein YabQ n=1 Tax=Calderihabitans maritimus TaxID=1246530 RepID=A0A1Z5HRT9_9FIRM|nr:spore cortex biosynthesis protein YabQ [Calderihabitans maritimus]